MVKKTSAACQSKCNKGKLVSGGCGKKKEKGKCFKGGIGKLVGGGGLVTGCKPVYSNKFGPLVDTDSCAPKILLAEAEGGHDFTPSAPVGNFTLGGKYKNKKLEIKGRADTGNNGIVKFKLKKPVKTDKNGEFSVQLPENTVAFSICAKLNVGSRCSGGSGCNKNKCCVTVGSQDFTQYNEDLYWMTYDGSANNLTDPRYGMVGEALLQVTPVSYADGVSTLAVRGPENPNPRVVSNSICKQTGSVPNTLNMTDLVWGFGQFLDHEIDLTPDGDSETMDVPTLGSDPNEDFPGRTISIHRSGFIEDSNPRTHPNHISAFIDATNVYGYSRERAYALRAFDGNGKLRVSGNNLMPLNTGGLDNANGGTSPDADLFLAGDVRANENVLLLAFHTLFVREHNRLMDDVVPGRYPQFVGKDEMMFQHGRRYVSGLMQAITYNEFLPALLGGQTLGAYPGYDDTVNAQIRKEFSTVGYRLGHTMLSDVLKVGTSGTLPLMNAFFNPDYIKTNGIDDLLLGGGLQVMQQIDGKIVDAVRNNLFGPPTASHLLDLATLNIQRGRDHGVGTYNDVREAYGLARVTSVTQITSDATVQGKLTALYGAGAHDHIDPWVGCIVEDHVSGAGVGETLVAILREQFGRLRAGDRYFYLNDAGLSDEEKEEISNTTLRDVIVRNTGLTNADFGGRSDVLHL